MVVLGVEVRFVDGNDLFYSALTSLHLLVYRVILGSIQGFLLWFLSGLWLCWSMVILMTILSPLSIGHSCSRFVIITLGFGF
jgi:hypothetical protein